MNFDLSEEQKMLADTARRMLEEASPPDRLRHLIDAGAEWDQDLWSAMSEMGLLGALIPEAFGGLGMSELDLGVISQELGRVNASVPFFSSIVLAATAIELAGSDAQKAKWLPGIASGEVVATFAYTEGFNGWSSDIIATTFDKGGLTGVKTPVADAGVAQIAVVLARDFSGPVLVVADLSTQGVTRTRLQSFDELRAHYSLTFENAAAEKLSGATAADILDRLFDRAATQGAFEAVGGAEACLYMARDYAAERQIFGRALSSYQAIKHKLADILMRVELARASAYFAAWAGDEGTALEAAQAAAAARLMAADAFEQAARENLQVHGGIGYTFEANCHFYYRRERTLALNLGSQELWADRLIKALPHLTGQTSSPSEAEAA